MFGPLRCTAVVLGLAVAAGCTHRAGTAGSASSPAATSPQTARAEEHDVDAFLKRLDRGSVVQSYRIDDERLIIVVDAGVWSGLGPGGQDALKRSLGEAWGTSYLRIKGPTNQRILLSVEDTGGNDLGSYFAR